MADGIPFRSRHGLQWQLVLVDPRLLKAAQRHLDASGPSHAIEQALRLAIRRPAASSSHRDEPLAH